MWTWIFAHLRWERRMSGSIFFCDTQRSKARVVVLTLLAVLTLGLLSQASAQTVISCSSGFQNSNGANPCYADYAGFSATANQFQINQSPTAVQSGSSIDLIPVGSNGGGHSGSSVVYQTPVNVQAFTSTFTFVPNGKNISFVLNNSTGNSYGYNGSYFAAGAGCEGGFSQAFTGGDPEPNHLFALELDQFSPLLNTAPYPYTFTYSSAQIYQANQSPCIPAYAGTFGTDPSLSKISTSPVPLNNPANQGLTTTGHTYSATIKYDGSNVSLDLYDITAGGSCPGSNCFTYTWSGVNIPSLVGSNTAYVGINGGTNSDAVGNLLISSLVYTAGSLSPAAASSPTFSPAAGTYTGSQNVALSSATSGAIICYSTTGSPATNGSTGCASGTLYAGPLTVSSNETIYAVAGGKGFNDSSVASGAYVIQPPATTPPIFSPAVGTYPSTQSVSLSDATSGASIYYTTNGTAPTTSSSRYAGPIAVSSTETVKAMASATGYANSIVASATYTISQTVATPTLSLSAGTYTSAQTVSISDATAGATIHYTTDGTTPTTSSAVYAGPITVNSTETLQAIAVESGYTNSAVASAAYTISAVSRPTSSPKRSNKHNQ
jgi:hypothetical protein